MVPPSPPRRFRQQLIGRRSGPYPTGYGPDFVGRASGGPAAPGPAQTLAHSVADEIARSRTAGAIDPMHGGFTPVA